MTQISESDLEYLSRVRKDEYDFDGVNGFSLRFIIGTFDLELYIGACHSINRLVNLGLLKVISITSEKLEFRHATPCEIVEWKTTRKPFNIFDFVLMPKSLKSLHKSILQQNDLQTSSE